MVIILLCLDYLKCIEDTSISALMFYNMQEWQPFFYVTIPGFTEQIQFLSRTYPIETGCHHRSHHRIS